MLRLLALAAGLQLASGNCAFWCSYATCHEAECSGCDAICHADHIAALPAGCHPWCNSWTCTATVPAFATFFQSMCGTCPVCDSPWYWDCSAAQGASCTKLGISRNAEARSGQPIEYPKTYHSSNGALSVELHVTMCDYVGPNTRFTTRCYNKQLPGPSLYVYPGETLSIKLVNTLSNAKNNHFHNFWQKLNYTNLHFHGGHVSANAPSDDVLTILAPGGNYHMTYVYHIPDFHMPGTAWYHPHVHGNAFLQIGGGMSGLIIIQDPPGYVPDFIANAVEMPLVLHHFPLGHYHAFGTQSCVSQEGPMMPTDCGTEGCHAPFSPRPGAGDMMTVNGMINPVITIQAGVWYRKRMLFASPLFVFDSKPVGDPAVMAAMQCEFHLLAKDNIYILDTPRRITKFFMWPGSRADDMMMCRNPGTIEVHGQAEGLNAMAATGALDMRMIAPVVGKVWTFNVVGPAVTPVEMQPFTIQRPCYVADTTSLVGNTAHVVKKDMVMDACPGGPPGHGRRLAEKAMQPELAQAAGKHLGRQLAGASSGMGPGQSLQVGVDPLAAHHNDVYTGFPIDPATGQHGGPPASNPPMSTSPGPFMGLEPTCGGLAGSMAWNDCFNGCRFEQGRKGNVTKYGMLFFQDQVGEPCGTIAGTMTTGQLIEWKAVGINMHPFHMHVNPYQVVGADYSFFPGGEAFFQANTGGMYKTGDFGDVVMMPVKYATLHQQMDNFATVQVVHCHILLHEDNGMMGAYSIGGTEGAVFAYAKTLDPTCYRSASEMTGFTMGRR